MSVALALKIAPDTFAVRSQVAEGVKPVAPKLSLSRGNRVAIEAATQLSASLSMPLVCVAVCDATSPNISMIAVELLGLGVNELYLIKAQNASQFDYRQTGMLLERAMKKIGTKQLTVCSDIQDDDGSPFLGSYLAGRLNIGYVDAVSAVTSIKSNSLVAKRETDSSIELHELSFPGAMGISVDYAAPHLPAVAELFAARQHGWVEWTPEDLGMTNSDVQSCGLSEAVAWMPLQKIERLQVVYQYPEQAEQFKDVLVETIRNEI